SLSPARRQRNRRPWLGRDHRAYLDPADHSARRRCLVKERSNPRAPSPDPPRNAEQRRAADALNAVRQLDREDEKLRERYRVYTERLGPSIVTKGLGQALASERAAAGPKPEKPEARAHDYLYRNLTTWLCHPGGVYQPRPGDPPDLLTALVTGSEALYVRA